MAKSIPDFRILFNHGGLWLKSISDFTILLATDCGKWSLGGFGGGGGSRFIRNLSGVLPF